MGVSPPVSPQQGGQGSARLSPWVGSNPEDGLGDLEFGGRLILRDGTGEVDISLDIDNEWIILKQGEEELGRYAFRDIHFVRWSEHRVSMNFAGEAADFYPFRPNEFIAALNEKRLS